jgi:serine protease inhibitor
MMAYINVDEEGTEAAALAETCCTLSARIRRAPQVVKADKPYIAFVYDTTVNRVLFIVKDMGCAGEELCGN